MLGVITVVNEQVIKADWVTHNHNHLENQVNDLANIL